MTKNASETTPSIKDDRILLQTRVVLLIVIPFLLLAFLILYFFPDTSGERFAWEIKPHMTALLIGSGYLGGAYMFVFAIREQRWHRISGAFPSVIAFTIAMMLATVLHWDRFDIHHFPFQVWLFLYAITPFLISFLWWKNRGTDPGTPEENDLEVPGFARTGFFVFGLAGTAVMLLMFLFPQTFIDIWPWKLTPLTTRILGGWFGLLGVGGLNTSRDPRWSAWRIPMQSITFWAVLVLIGAFRNPSDFAPAGIFNPFTIGTSVSIVMMVGFQVWMEMKKKRAAV